MKILVDTSVWSLAFRRKMRPAGGFETTFLNELVELIEDGRAQMIGPVRQELLCGIREEHQYTQLRQRVRAFPDEPLVITDYERSAQVTNQCNSAGISGSPIDFLICAAAMERG